MEYTTEQAIMLLREMSTGCRYNGARALAKVENPSEEVVSALAAAVQDPDGYVRLFVVRAIGRVGAHAPEIAVPALLEALRNDTSWLVKAEMVDALAEIACLAEDEMPELIPVLQEALDDVSFDVRKSAAYALYRLQ